MFYVLALDKVKGNLNMWWFIDSIVLNFGFPPVKNFTIDYINSLDYFSKTDLLQSRDKQTMAHG